MAWPCGEDKYSCDQATLYYHKHTEDVVLWFPEQDEYEGMEGGYRVRHGKILDADGDEVPRLRAVRGHRSPYVQ